MNTRTETTSDKALVALQSITRITDLLSKVSSEFDDLDRVLEQFEHCATGELRRDVEDARDYLLEEKARFDNVDMVKTYSTISKIRRLKLLAHGDDFTPAEKK